MKKIVSFLIVSIFFFSCAVLTKSADDASVKENIDTVSGSKNSINMEGRKSGTPGIEKAAVYIESEFKKIGLSTFGDLESYRQTFTFKNRRTKEDITSSNIIAVLEGKSKKDEYVIISAHYDHLGYGHSGSLHDGDKEIHNGADDNASGVSILINLVN